MRPSQTLRVLEDLFAKQTGRLYRNGVELSLQDSLTVRDVYTQWVLLLTDLGYLTLVSHKGQLGRILSDVFNTDVYELISAFSDCVDAVRYRRLDGFKARLDTVSSHLFAIFKNSFFKMLEGDVRQAKLLIQAFSYMGRLSLRDIDLTDQCLTDYMATEKSMTENFPAQLIKSLESIIKSWTLGFDPSDLVFRHGPGGVAGLGRTTLENKYKSLFRDPLIDRVFKFDYYTGIFSSCITSAPDRISQTIFVPKSYKAFRTISMEPATLMYLQQGVWREIDRMVLSSPYLRKRIDFHDQTRNQKLAKVGSITRGYATIDLSAASDSVSWELVRSLFRDTALFPYLEATRSTHTFLPNKQLVELKKFAPMGSALCFPIETLIFAAICEHSCRKMSRVQSNSVLGDYSVFGDDIIVPNVVVKDLEWSLNALGFSVNNSKSFTNPNDWFRESCGAEYCDGFDVTPIRVSRNYAAMSDVKSLTGCVDLSNACYEAGFQNLRAFFINKMRHFRFKVERKNKRIKIVRFLPLFGNNALKGDNYTNYHTKTRYNTHLQRNEALQTVLVSRTSRGDDDIALRHWLESSIRRTCVIDALESNVGERSIEPTNRWSGIETHFECVSRPISESDSNLELFKTRVGKVLYPMG